MLTCLFCTHDISCISVCPGRGIPLMLLSLRFLCERVFPHLRVQGQRVSNAACFVQTMQCYVWQCGSLYWVKRESTVAIQTYWVSICADLHLWSEIRSEIEAAKNSSLHHFSWQDEAFSDPAGWTLELCCWFTLYGAIQVIQVCFMTPCGGYRGSDDWKECEVETCDSVERPHVKIVWGGNWESPRSSWRNLLVNIK